MKGWPAYVFELQATKVDEHDWEWTVMDDRMDESSFGSYPIIIADFHLLHAASHCDRRKSKVSRAVC
jgi:hypothetical protein